MAQTEINNIVDQFLNSDVDITLEEFQKRTKDLFSHNSYGNFAHACVYHKFPEERVLSFLDLLFSNGVDVNYQAESTGYTFLHLALYGYTDKDGQDVSYSTDFILKLLSLALKYHFNVNAQNLDKDTIIHTAFASEVYTGSVAPLLDMISSHFSFSILDNQNHDVFQAFVYYKKIAPSDGSWFKRLEQEENSIMHYEHLVKKEKYQQEFLSVCSQLDALLNDSSVFKVEKELDSISSFLQSLLKLAEFDIEKDVFMNKIKEYYLRINQILEEEASSCLAKHSFTSFMVISKIKSTLNLSTLEKVDLLEKEYFCFVENLQDKIKEDSTIPLLNEDLERLDLLDEKLKKELEGVILQKIDRIQKKIEATQVFYDQYQLVQSINSDLLKDFSIFSVDNILNLPEEQIDCLFKQNEENLSIMNQKIHDYVFSTFQDSIKPFIDANFIHLNDLLNEFYPTKNKTVKVKKKEKS